MKVHNKQENPFSGIKHVRCGRGETFRVIVVCVLGELQHHASEEYYFDCVASIFHNLAFVPEYAMGMRTEIKLTGKPLNEYDNVEVMCVYKAVIDAVRKELGKAILHSDGEGS
jgi:hypothetical protein